MSNFLDVLFCFVFTDQNSGRAWCHGEPLCIVSCQPAYIPTPGAVTFSLCIYRQARIIGSQGMS